EAGGGVEEGCALAQGDRLLAGVDEVGVLLAVDRVGPHAEDAVLGLQHELDVVRHEAGHERRQADAEVDVVAVGQLGGGAGSHLLPGQGHAQASLLSTPAAAGTCGAVAGRTVRRSIRLSAACAAVRATTRWT